jgi:hypothetical protein
MLAMEAEGYKERDAYVYRIQVLGNGWGILFRPSSSQGLSR